MEIKLVNRGSEGELLLIGRLDAKSAPETEEIFKQMAERYDKVILNMGQLDYISSAGLRVIKIIYMAMRKKNGSLVIKNVKKLVYEVFEMTGFAGLLDIE